jgi:hypothetical protein
MRILRASEIGTYLYCQRAWWYQKRGEKSENQAELSSGSELHYRHGREAFASGCLRTAAYILMLAAVVLLAAYLTTKLV